MQATMKSQTNPDGKIGHNERNKISRGVDIYERTNTKHHRQTNPGHKAELAAYGML